MRWELVDLMTKQVTHTQQSDNRPIDNCESTGCPKPSIAVLGLSTRKILAEFPCFLIGLTAHKKRGTLRLVPTIDCFNPTVLPATRLICDKLVC
jgi:hypothetical protein